MDLVQWIVPDPGGSPHVVPHVLWVPAWAERVPALGALGPLRRRGAPLVSRWLSTPIAVAVSPDAVDDDQAAQLPKTPGACSVRLGLVVDDAAGEPVVAPAADDMRFASLLGEFVRCITDLCEAAGLPVMAVGPAWSGGPRRAGAEVLLGSLSAFSATRLGDALVLLATAVRLAALARGLRLQDAVLVVGDRTVVVDGGVFAALTDGSLLGGAP